MGPAIRDLVESARTRFTWRHDLLLHPTMKLSCVKRPAAQRGIAARMRHGIKLPISDTTAGRRQIGHIHGGSHRWCVQPRSARDGGAKFEDCGFSDISSRPDTL
jgi:hypothetical protein